MGNDTILYYVLEETITCHKRNIRKSLFGKIKLSSFIFEEDDISVAVVMIPSLDKGWKRNKLLRLMQEEADKIPALPEGAEIIIQPEAGALIGVEEDFSPIFWRLSGRLIENSFFSMGNNKKQDYPESIILLMGNTFFPEEQMQRFNEMMQQFFPKINNFAVVYETEDDIYVQDENDGTVPPLEQGEGRFKDAVADCMDMFYYEYGLVGEICINGDFRGKFAGMANRRGLALYLDYGYQGKLPYKIMKAGGIYLDVVSSAKKEAQIRKKCSEISYLSARKYLDTMVKSGYDKLVNQT